MRKFGLILATLLLFSSDLTRPEASPTAPYTKHPIQWQQPYPMQCGDRLPMLPVCVWSMGGSIESLMSADNRRAKFNSCRRDVENFVAAVKFYAQCYEKALKDYVNEVLSEVDNRIICEEQEIRKIENGQDAQHCPSIIMPSFPNILQKGDLIYVPETKPLVLLIFPCNSIDDVNDLESREVCVSKLQLFYFVEAQTYLEENLENFYNGERLYPKREGVKKYINKVIEEFNCKASGKSFCH